VALTGQDVLNQLNKVTLPQMLAGIVAVVVALSAANYFLEIAPMQEDIARKQAEAKRLETELIAKQAIANSLDESKRQMAVLERRLAQALTELPNESNIDDLIRSLSEIGQKSGLTINTIEPRGENRKQLYAEIPIAMNVSGAYHEIAFFLDAVSRLARIVNVTNIRMGGSRPTAEKLMLNASYIATTFRSLPTAPDGAKK
jgi:type IV pilus assembly protein PilO